MAKPKMSRVEALAFNRKMRKWTGNRPDSKKGWFRAGDTTVEAQGVLWAVYMRFCDRTADKAKDGPWWAVKLVAGYPIRERANYWLAHNGRRWADVPDMRTARDRIPEILDEVEEIVLNEIPMSEREEAEFDALTML